MVGDDTDSSCAESVADPFVPDLFDADAFAAAADVTLPPFELAPLAGRVAAREAFNSAALTPLTGAPFAPFTSARAGEAPTRSTFSSVIAATLRDDGATKIQDTREILTNQCDFSSSSWKIDF